MSQPLMPQEYEGLFKSLLRFDIIRAVMELRAAGWKHLYGDPTTYSYVVEDPTGNFAIKANLHHDTAYEAYAETLVPDGGSIGTVHVPTVYMHAKLNNPEWPGSLTLMERLYPVESGSVLFKKRHSIRAGSQVQFEHMTGVNPQFGGSLPAIREAIGEDDENLTRLAACLGTVKAMCHTDFSRWGFGDIMKRQDGTEVLVDPFDRVSIAQLAQFRASQKQAASA